MPTPLKHPALPHPRRRAQPKLLALGCTSIPEPAPCRSSPASRPRCTRRPNKNVERLIPVGQPRQERGCGGRGRRSNASRSAPRTHVPSLPPTDGRRRWDKGASVARCGGGRCRPRRDRPIPRHGLRKPPCEPQQHQQGERGPDPEHDAVADRQASLAATRAAADRGLSHRRGCMPRTGGSSRPASRPRHARTP